MRVNRSYLKGLSVLLLMFLGGCSWVTHLNWPSSTNKKSNSQAITSTKESSDGLSSQSFRSSAGIDHGERLSTLKDELPPGRLPSDILPATGNVQRLPEIESGRHDPFASLPVRPFLVQQPPAVNLSSEAVAAKPIILNRPSQPEVQPITIPPSPEVVVPVPITQQFRSPPLVPTQFRVPVEASPTNVPAAVTSVDVPSGSIPVDAVGLEAFTTETVVPPSPDASPSFEFSGVVQVGDRVNIIVEEPSGSRYVEVGARVGNGQFVIKAVDFNQGPNPAVILEKGGTESIHWIGNPIAM